MVNRCTFRRSSGWDQRGQVTIFIIVGIILVFAFAGILYFTRSAVTQEIISEEEPLLVSVPQQFVPVQRYTENCLSQIGKRGIKVLGESGGYIYPDLVGKYSLSDPTNSDGVLIGTQGVPFWYYNAQPNSANSVSFSSLRPELYEKNDPAMSIEAQLARYVKEQLDSCLNNYSALSTLQVQFLDGGQKEVKARVGETGIVFTLNMNLRVILGQDQSDLNQFSIKVPIHFKHYYDVASKISSTEQEVSFLERQGMELISIYGYKDPEKLAPLSDLSFDRISTLTWQVDDLQRKVKELLTSYVPMLRFLGSSNFYHATFPDNEVLVQKITDNMILTLDGAEDVNVNFDYLGWAPYLKVNSVGGKVEPESVHVNFLNFDYSQQRFDTHYDVSYPVLVTLKDDNAFDGEGYQFVFALESNIRNNKPAVADQPWKVETTFMADSLTCHENTWVAGDLKTVVVDSYTKEPISEVKVTFSVPNREDCDVGITDVDGELSSKYPAVYGGLMGFMKEEYLTNFYPIDTYKYRNTSALIGYAVQGAASSKVIELDKIKTINVTVKKKELKECVTPVVCKYTFGSLISPINPYKDISCKRGNNNLDAWEKVQGDASVGPFCYMNEGDNFFDKGKPVYSFEVNFSLSRYHDYYFVDKEVSLSPEETALITLERVKSLHPKSRDEPFSTVITSEGGVASEVQLVPGVYKVSGMVTSEKEITVPDDKRCNYMDLVSTETEDCQNIPGITSDKQVIGGVNFMNEDTYITITPEQLYGLKEITLYMLTQDVLPEEGALSAPPLVPSKEIDCQGTGCVANVGCAAVICEKKDIWISGIVPESLGIFGKICDLSASPEVYESLQPTFS